MKQILIFEGVDQSGKSSIAKELSRRLGSKHFKNPSEKTQFFVDDNRITWIIEATYLFNLISHDIINKIILDRHIPSEYAYSYAYGRKTDGAKIVEFDAKLAQLGACIIYCFKDSYEQYDDWAVKQKDRAKIVEGYELYLEQTRMPYLKLNTTDQNLEKQIEMIMSFLKNNGVIGE